MKLSVAGDILASRYIATSTLASIFPYASSTAISATIGYFSNASTTNLNLGFNSTILSTNGAGAVQATGFSGPLSFSGSTFSISQLVRKGAPTKIFWNVDNVESCTVASPHDSFTGATSGPSGQQSAAINQQTVFSLDCTGLDGTTIHETATAGVVPVFQEI